MAAAMWIWYPGEYEVWLSYQVHTRRRDLNGAVYPPIWHLPRPTSTLWAWRDYNLAEPETVEWQAAGDATVRLDGQVIYSSSFTVPAGHHRVEARVFNAQTFPALYMRGATVQTDQTWQVGRNTTHREPAACGEFTDATMPPQLARLPVSHVWPMQQVQDVALSAGQHLTLDFGREMYGYLELTGLSGSGELELRFGESQPEAEYEQVVQRQRVQLTEPLSNWRTELGAAFRYVCLTPINGTCRCADVSAWEEYLPVARLGRFRSSDERLNSIWEVSARTLELCSREFFLDGIKRDHWVWSGDAYQEMIMSFYLFHDQGICRRTLMALRGATVMEHHINTIMDYSFYWVLALWSYYLYTGDLTFLQAQYVNMRALLSFCTSRTNERGLMERRPGDWVFVDWAPMDNSGEVATEQILYAEALQQASAIACLLGHSTDGNTWRADANRVWQLVDSEFWNDTHKAYMHNRHAGRLSDHVTRYPHIFAILFGHLAAERRAAAEQVLLNPSVQSITTPYMRFYELSALCEAGQQSMVLDEIRTYWGAMLDLGATSFWETYDPKEHGLQHYAMYGDPFGKSLCHGWGASPLYLLGRYFLGVQPDEPGYKAFTVQPYLGDLVWMEGAVPVPGGVVEVRMDSTSVEVRSDIAGGELVLVANSVTVADAQAQPIADVAGRWRVPIPQGKTLVVTYKRK